LQSINSPNSKKWVFNIGFDANISRMVCIFGIPFSQSCCAYWGLWIGRKKFGLPLKIIRLENYPPEGGNFFFTIVAL